MYNFDCVIIGSGIAGMTAAIYLKRANLNVVIIDNDAPGGLLNKINKIENYPGFISITGPDLAYKIYEQVKNLDIEIRYGNVLSIEDHIIKTDIEQITANKIILATGRKAKKIDDNALNISYCVVCDGNLYNNKKVAVIGNENSIEDVIYLSNICGEVIFISSDKIKTDFKQKNIKKIDLCKIEKLNQVDNKINKVITNKGEYEIDGLFISLGYEPKMNFLDEINKEKGYILVDNNMRTNIDYIYACGDCIKKDVYQLTTAVSDATLAAINVKKALN